MHIYPRYMKRRIKMNQNSCIETLDFKSFHHGKIESEKCKFYLYLEKSWKEKKIGWTEFEV